LEAAGEVEKSGSSLKPNPNKQAKLESKSGLVVCKIDSRSKGRGFESHPILDGNGFTAMPGSYPFCTQSWLGHQMKRKKI